MTSLHAMIEGTRLYPQGKPKKIVLEAGSYFLEEPLVLDERDSGLTVESAPGAEATLYGGRLVADWKKEGDRFYSALLPGVKAGRWDFRCLVVNGRLAPRARLPEQGVFTHLSEFDVKWMSTTGGGWQRKPTEKELTTLKYEPGDLGGWLDTKNAELTIYHMWDESLVGVLANDATNHVLTFSNPSGHPPGAFRVKKYVVWNVPEGMTTPGQWYLDRAAGRLVYWPLPDEDMDSAEIIAPAVETVLRIAGSAGRPAERITIRGIGFSATTTPLKAGGFGAGAFEGAVSVACAQDCRLAELRIFNTGGQGIKASGKNIRIEGCRIHHTGACGVKFEGGGSLIENNHVHDTGVAYPSAIAVWAGGRKTEGVRIRHNEVHDTPYTAIACAGDNHEISDNLIYRAMRELHDGAGIYITFCKGVHVHGNLIRDIVDTGSYGASAYYLDEQAENCLVEGNLSYNVAWPSHNHMARGNVIRNNVFAAEGDAQLTFPRCSDYRFEKNVICAAGAIVLSNPQAIGAAADNILHSGNGSATGAILKDYEKVESVPLKGRGGFLLADPLLAEYRSGRVLFAADSPARKAGIRPIDVSAAGRTERARERR